jgi:hypothetical protein
MSADSYSFEDNVSSSSDGITGGWAEYSITSRHGNLMHPIDYGRSYIGAHDVLESVGAPSELIDARDEVVEKLYDVKKYTSYNLLNDEPQNPDDPPIIIPPLSGDELNSISLTDTHGLISAIDSLANAFSIKIEGTPIPIDIHASVGVSTADQQAVEQLERDILPYIQNLEAIQIWVAKQMKRISAQGQWPKTEISRDL